MDQMTTQDEKHQLKTQLTREMEKRRAARAKEIRASLRWYNLARDRWNANTTVGRAFVAKVQDHHWICGFIGGQEWPARSLLEAKEQVALWLEEHAPG